jgi:hypothetical protein
MLWWIRGDPDRAGMLGIPVFDGGYLFLFMDLALRYKRGRENYHHRHYLQRVHERAGFNRCGGRCRHW